MSEYSIIIITLILSAFFSGMEIALVASNKLKIFLEKEQGRMTSKIVLKFTENPTNFIITMLIGNNIALVVYGIYMAYLLEPIIATYIISIPFFVLLIQVIFSSLLVLLVAEFLPKVIFSLFPNRLLKLFAFPAAIVIKLFAPFALFIKMISNFLIKILFKTSSKDQKLMFSRVDLDAYLEEHNEIAKDSTEGIDPEVEILKNALDFASIKVRDCMVPRTDIVGISINDSVLNLRKKFIQTGHSKIIVYKENLDNIIGYVHSYEFFKKPQTIKDILLPISLMPESILVQDALDKLMKDRRSVALILDEYGGTAGLICVEDIIEELVGEIEDEHDQAVFAGRQIDDNKYHFLGKQRIDEINKEYKINFPISEEYDTLSGYIVSSIGRIPKNQELIKLNNHEFKILKINDNFIEELVLCVL